ncbi:hypothetical protein ACFQGT_06300 [Natrialbaceae archaeon GCM10025810]|uniref:hypothetical protein n=1 Tax=Halovalidus salilacus TaxID=3075124 RepID=UPI0036209566
MVTLLYGFAGMVLGVVFDRVAGLWTILVVSMLDIGLFQSPLFPMGEDAWWVKMLPGYHPMEVVFDAGLTAQSDTLVHLGWALGYLFLAGVIAVLLFYRLTGGQRTSRFQVIP